MEASIIIPTYNRLYFLKRALRALSRLTYPRDNYEVIVVDDGSEDGTDQFLGMASFPFHLRFVRHSDNRFASAARNTGIRKAQGEIIVLLDDDMEVVPEFLAEHVKCHSMNQRLAVAGNIQMAPEIIPTGIIRYLSTRGAHKLKLTQSIPFKYWCSGNASIRRSILLEIGLFDERIQQYGGEDLELSFRLKKYGDVSFSYAPKAISYHLYYRDFSDVCKLMFQYGHTSLIYMIQKHPDLATTVRAHLIEPIRFGHDSLSLFFKKVLLKIVMNPIIYAVLNWYARKLKSGKPSFIFDYIIASNYLTGLRKALQSSETPL